MWENISALQSTGGANRRFLLADFTVTHNTAAFLFPLISLLLHSGLGGGGVSGVMGFGKNKRYAPSGLILAPTRELASQIHEEAVKFTRGTSLHPVVVYGGQDIRHQFRELDRGCDILVATPGRLMDFLERGRVTLSQVGYLVFDEADRMLDMGFEPQIRSIVQGGNMPQQHRQTLMFSATFPKEIQRLAQDFLYSYLFIAIGRVGSSSDLITQRVEYCEDEDKDKALLRLLPQCQGLTLIFVERKRTADMLESLPLSPSLLRHFHSRGPLSAREGVGPRSLQGRQMSLPRGHRRRCAWPRHPPRVGCHQLRYAQLHRRLRPSHWKDGEMWKDRHCHLLRQQGQSRNHQRPARHAERKQAGSPSVARAVVERQAEGEGEEEEEEEVGRVEVGAKEDGVRETSDRDSLEAEAEGEGGAEEFSAEEGEERRPWGWTSAWEWGTWEWDWGWK